MLVLGWWGEEVVEMDREAVFECWMAGASMEGLARAMGCGVREVEVAIREVLVAREVNRKRRGRRRRGGGGDGQGED